MTNPPAPAQMPELVLKACPFCGGVAELGKQTYDELEREEPQTAWSVMCHSCEVYQIPLSLKQSAIEAWNRRAESSRLSELEAKLREAEKDAERWRHHGEIVRMSSIPGALRVRLTIRSKADGGDKVWETEYVFDTDALGQTFLGLKAIGMSVEPKAAELFAAIDAARERGEHE